MGDWHQSNSACQRVRVAGRVCLHGETGRVGVTNTYQYIPGPPRPGPGRAIRIWRLPAANAGRQLSYCCCCHQAVPLSLGQTLAGHSG